MTTTKTKGKELPLHPRCDRKRCMNEAQMFPLLIIPAPRWSHNPKAKIEMELDVNVCPRHAIEEVDYFVDDAGWYQLVQNLAARRMAAPNRKNLKIIFKALEDRKFG